MSMNYQELAKTADALKSEFPLGLKRVGLIEFLSPNAPLPVSDLNLGFETETGEILVFCFRAPWVGLYFLSSEFLRDLFKAQGQSILWKPVSQFSQAFGGINFLLGKEIIGIESLSLWPNDRVVELSLVYEENARSQGTSSPQQTAVFRAQLFPAKPNWEFEAAGQKLGWRGEISNLPRPTAAFALGQVRDIFQGLAAKSFLRVVADHFLKLRFAESRKLFMERIFVWVRSRQAHFRKISQELESSKRESEKAQKLRLYGETLKSVLHEYPKTWRGSAIQVDGLEIPIQEGLSLPEQSAKFFHNARKFERTEIEVKARETTISSVLQKLTRVAQALLQLAKNSEDLSFDLVQEAQKIFREEALTEGTEFIAGLAHKKPAASVPKRQKLFEKAGLKSYSSKEGHRIWVGRNAKENEELVMRLAKGNDLWMHLKGKPGAHVVVQAQKNKSVSLETLLDAALLCAFYSDVKVGSKVEVDYTPRKNVKRISGGNKGRKPGKDSGKQFLVTYSQNKTLMVGVTQEKLQAALSR